MYKPEITKELLAELKEKAKKATPGPWVLEIWSGQGTATHVKQGLTAGNGAHVASYVNGPCAEYIAAANPQVMLALIARIEESEKEADWLAEQLSRLANRLFSDANGNLVSSCPENASYKPVFDRVAEHGSCKDCWRQAARKAVEEQ